MLLAIVVSVKLRTVNDTTDLEFVTEWLIVEKDPRILILSVPMVF